MAYGAPPDAFDEWIRSQLAPQPAAPMQQDIAVIPVSPSTLGNPEPPKPPPPPVEKIGAAPAATEIAGPSAPAPVDFAWPPPEWAEPFEIDMPPMDMSSLPQIGYPREPGTTGEIEMPPMQMGEETPSQESSLEDLIGRGAQAIGLDARHPAMPDDYILGNPDPIAGAEELEALPADRRARVEADFEDQRFIKAKELEQQALMRREELRKSDEAAAQRHLESMQRAKMETDAILAEARAIAQTKIKPETGTARHVLMGILGGLIQGKSGSSTNQGLEMVNREIERDIALQKENLANRRMGLQMRQNALGEMLQRTGDIEKAEAAVRVAGYESFIEGLKTEMGKFDPNGTQIVELARMHDQAIAQREAAAKQLFDKNVKQQIELGEYGLKVRKQQLEEAKFENEMAAQQAKLAGGSGGAAVRPGTELVTPDEVRRRYPGLPEQAIPKVPITEAALGKHLEQYGKGRGIEDQDKALQIGDATGKPLRNKDHSVWRAPNREIHAALAKQVNGTRELISTLGQIEGLWEEAGGANKFTSQGDNLEYNRLVKKAVYAYAAATGVSTSDEASFNAVRDALMGGDPSGYNVGDVAKRIRSGISEAKGSVNSAMRLTGLYDGPALTFPTVTKPAESAAAGKVRRLSASTTGANENVTPVALAAVPMVGQYIAIGERLVNAARSEDFTPTDQEKQDVDSLIEGAYGSDPEARNAALEQLKAVINKTGSPAVKAYAMHAFARGVGGKR